MKEINIARTVIAKRKAKGITQDELANYIGVSKASVSKWETEQSYPDIVLLPQLATFFNISIDELMGYEPQMTKQDIEKLYRRLYEDLSKKPFDEVIEECREIIKKYFSCFPLLLQMGTLLINLSVLAGDSEKSSAIITEAKELFVRIKKESADVEVMRSAVCMEATCAISLINPNEAIELLEKTIVPVLPQEILLASAYRMTERNTEAEKILQVGIYQAILSTVSMLSAYAMFSFEDVEKSDEIVNRTLSIIEAFNIKKLQPSTVVSFFLTTAQGYQLNQETEKSLDFLEQFAELVCGDISYRLKGDDFFNSIDDWLNETGAENPITVHETVRQSMVEAVVNNPVLSALKQNSRFQRIVKKLEDNV